MACENLPRQALVRCPSGRASGTTGRPVFLAFSVEKGLDPARHEIACLTDPAFVEMIAGEAWIEVHLERPCAAMSGGLDEAGGRIDGAGRPDRNEQVRGHQRPIDPVHLVRHLAEPDDVGPQLPGDAAAGAGWMIAERLVPGRARIAGEAPGRVELAVHVKDPARAGALVKVVDILGDD